jgi:hypothetical protein
MNREEGDKSATPPSKGRIIVNSPREGVKQRGGFESAAGGSLRLAANGGMRFSAKNVRITI